MFSFPCDANFDYLKTVAQEHVLELRVTLSSNNSYVLGSGTSKIIIESIGGYTWDDKLQAQKKDISFQEISKVTAKKLGCEGLDRLNKFREYQAGWDFGKGLPLSDESLTTMDYFLNQFSNFHANPSVFMNSTGNLLLGWEDKGGKRIELEFHADAIEYYIESLDEEERIVLDRNLIASLINKLHQI